MNNKSKITNNEIKRLANLSRLEITEDEIGKYAVQLNEIVKYVSKLDEIDLNNVEPLYHVLDQTITGREDTVKPSLDVNELLTNAPQTKGEFFKVPPVIKGKKKSK